MQRKEMIYEGKFIIEKPFRLYITTGRREIGRCQFFRSLVSVGRKNVLGLKFPHRDTTEMENQSLNSVCFYCQGESYWKTILTARILIYLSSHLNQSIWFRHDFKSSPERRNFMRFSFATYTRPQTYTTLTHIWLWFLFFFSVSLAISWSTENYDEG